MPSRTRSGRIFRRGGLRAVVLTLAMALVLAVLSPLVAAADGAAPPASNGELVFSRSVLVPSDGGTSTVRATLHRIQPDGTGEVRLGTIAGRSTPLGISPDSRRMLWLEELSPEGRPPSQLLLQVGNPDGSGRTTVQELGPQPDVPFYGDRARATWSADGLSIAYLSQGRPFVVDAEGEGSRPLPAPAGRVTSLDWSPLGDRIALVVGPVGDPLAAAVWVMDADGQRQQRVYSSPVGTPGSERAPTAVRWSPDGQRLAVVESAVMQLDCAFRALTVLGADGARPTPVVADPSVTCSLGGLTWSPDGTQFAAEVAASYADGTSIVRFPAAGGRRVALTDAGVWTDRYEQHQLAAWRPVPDLMAAACPAGAPRADYPDIDGLFHARAIDCVTWWGVAEGGTDGTFGPASSVTRGQMASFVVRALEAVGETLPAPPTPRFADTADTVHGERIEQLAEAGIVEGVGDSLFAPGRPVTRAQMAAFLARAEAWRTGTPLPAVPDAFTDDDGRVLEEEIDRVSAVGLATGIRDRTFAPGAEVSRGQMATFLARLLDRAVRDASASPPGAA
jgi:hypothetical protein